MIKIQRIIITKYNKENFNRLNAQTHRILFINQDRENNKNLLYKDL